MRKENAVRSAEEWRDEHPCKPFPHVAFLQVHEIRAIQADCLRHVADMCACPNDLAVELEAQAEQLEKP